MNFLPHITGRMFDTPLLIARAKLDTIMGILMPRISGEALPFSKKVVAQTYEVTNNIAIIPITGTLVRRTVGLEAQSGLTSYNQIADDLDAALADPSVKGILLDIDSPGGEAGGVFDLADRIFALRQAGQQSQSRLRSGNAGAQSRRDQTYKPIYAVANEEAFSAAYAIAAAAEKIFVSRTSGVGSIGVIAVHLDQSQAEADAGLKYTAIYAGDHKNDLSPHEPLTDPARATLQAEVDRVYGMFVTSVARMRGVDVAAIKNTQAALYFGDQAVTAKLADSTGTFADALAALQQKITAPSVLKSIPSRSLKSNPKQKEFPMPETETSLEADGQIQAQAEIQVAQQSVIDMPALKEEAKREALAYVTEVTELCQLAAMPDKAMAFIAKAVPIAEVRKALLDARAAQADASAIVGQIPASTSPTNAETKIDTAAIYAARNQKK